MPAHSTGDCRCKTPLKLCLGGQPRSVRISSAPVRDTSVGRGRGGAAKVRCCALVVVVTETAVRAAQTAQPDAELAAAIEAARALERWGSARSWVGPDPYDALNARRLPHLTRRSPLALRVVTQAVKRSPLNLRPILGIPNGLSAATLAHTISAYARNGFLDAEEAHTKLRRCIEQPHRAPLRRFSRALLGLPLRRSDARLLLPPHQSEHDRDRLRRPRPPRRL